MGPVRTVGHGTLTAAAFVALVRSAGIETVVDVRRYPGSRRHPQFGGDAMAAWLPEHEVGYRWLPALGGRRGAATGSANRALRNEQFRAYADHMASAEFGAGITELVGLAGERPVGVMCAESVWWRCHRRLLADHLVLVRDVGVEHLFHDGRVAPHVPAPEARRAGSHLVYDVGVQVSLLDDE
jgi:uncharacterized protein (DUF488 family)